MHGSSILARNVSGALAGRLGLLLALLCGGLSFVPDVAAQRNVRLAPIPPQVFGFDIPNGRIRPGDNRVVLTRDARGAMVTAKIHVEVGDYLILLMPDGQLVARSKGEVQGTDRPFTAASKDAIAKELVEGPYKGFRTRQTKRFLYVFNSSDNFATVASRILETEFPGIVAYARAQKIDVHEPDVPLVVVMYKDENEFHKATGVGRGVVAFYSIIDNRVSMYEQSKLDAVAPDLAAQQLVSTIAHEGAHQILANIGVEKRLSRWPMWLSEGMAEFFAATTTDNRFRWKGAGQPNDMRMFELEAYMARTLFDSDGLIYIRTIESARLTSTGYASAWSLTHYLATRHREAFHAYVNEVSQFGPLEGDVGDEIIGLSSNRKLFEKHFGDDFSGLERQIVRHLNGLPYKRPFGR